MAKLFIASSVEQLDLAYAVQENLEHVCECTVWSQGVFQLSRTAMSSLVDTIGDTDFSVFIFAPDDVQVMRDVAKRQVRDNVIFELGRFAGRLGIERCFMIVPRGMDDLQIPSDLLGLTPTTYEPQREDGNLNAALGPACNRVRKTVQQLGKFCELSSQVEVKTVLDKSLISEKDDVVLLIERWLGARQITKNKKPIRLFEVDAELGLAPGSASEFLALAAERYRYGVVYKSEKLIQLERDEKTYDAGILHDTD